MCPHLCNQFERERERERIVSCIFFPLQNCEGYMNSSLGFSCGRVQGIKQYSQATTPLAIVLHVFCVPCHLLRTCVLS